MDDGTAILIDTEKSTTHILNESAWVLWTLLEQPATPSQLLSAFLSSFEIEAEEVIEVLQDMAMLLGQLQEKDLLSLHKYER